MDKAYEKSLLMIKLLKIRLTKKQYTQLAKRFNLLSIASLQYMSQRSFESIVHKIVNEKEVV